MPLFHADLLRLKRWNTPTICNGWEQITAHDISADGFNLDEPRDFMPQMGPMVGYAVTLVIEPSAAGGTTEELLARLDAAAAAFRKATQKIFRRGGEW